MWRRKFLKSKFLKPKVFNFIVRYNRTYQILFRKDELFIDDKLTWVKEDKNMESNFPCFIKFIGTGPQNFRRRMKKKKLKGNEEMLEKDSSIEQR